jgi:hypothetical protein
MNAEQYRRVETQLSVVAEFFAETKNLGEPAQALREDLRLLIDKVVAERQRAEASEKPSPHSRRPW